MNIAKPPMNQAKPPPNTPILIVLAYYEGDRGQARDVASLMADLQPHHVHNAAKVLVVCRQDSEIDPFIVSKLSEEFDVMTFKASSPLRGWPGGCNGIFTTTAQYICDFIGNIDCWFFMEADCVPMCTNWFADLSNTWRDRTPGKLVVGHMLDCNGNGTGMHITGCALYHPCIIRLIPKIAYSDSVAWDYGCRREIVANGENTHAIALKYRPSSLDENILNERQVVTHGYKDLSLINLVRQRRVAK